MTLSLDKQARLRHWWREPLAGSLSLFIGSFDAWVYGRDRGLTSSLDEILIITGIGLIAGVAHLFPSKEKKTEELHADH
jgi:hypothetical protein